MSGPVRNSLCALAFSTLAACGLTESLANLEPRSYAFSPTVSGIRHVSHVYNTGTCSGLDRRGTGSGLLEEWRRAGGLEARGLLVGFSSILARGQDPFPCNLWLHHTFQGKAFFDLGALPAGAILRSARLTYTRRPVTLADRGPASTPCGYQAGVAEGLATGRYERFPDPSGRIDARPTAPERALSAVGHDVTRTVGRWVRAGSSDNWIVFSVEGGRALAEHTETDDVAYCAMHLDDIMLELEMWVPPDA